MVDILNRQQLFASNFIYSSIDNGNKVIGIFLDLKKAFDLVNHSILIKKLEFCGIALNLCYIIQIYRKLLKFKIITISYLINVSCRVLQGTVLGPFLFLIYKNGLFNILTFSVVFNFLLHNLQF